MKILIVGGTGHVGRFMAPMLVRAGHEVYVAGSGRTPPPPLPDWDQVRFVKQAVQPGVDLQPLRDLAAEVVIDMPGVIGLLYDGLKDITRHFIACGSLWMFGLPRVVPTPEVTQNPCFSEGYARRYAELRQLMPRAAADGVALTAIMPPNICGPGKIPLDCLGGRDLELHRRQAQGAPATLPDGPDALIGPCDAEDIARCFVAAVSNRPAAAGEFFNVGSAYALTAEQLVATFSGIFHAAIPIERVSWAHYTAHVSPGQGHWWHFQAHMCPDISKARRLLGYEPAYTPEQTLARAVAWMRAEGLL